MNLGRRNGIAAVVTTAILVSAGLPSIANADDSSIAGVLEGAETVAVGAPTPIGAESPVVQDGRDGVTVDVNGG